MNYTKRDMDMIRNIKSFYRCLEWYREGVWKGSGRYREIVKKGSIKAELWQLTHFCHKNPTPRHLPDTFPTPNPTPKKLDIPTYIVQFFISRYQILKKIFQRRLKKICYIGVGNILIDHA